MQYVWFIWSLIILVAWVFIYLLGKDARKEMLAASIWTMPLGLSEPLFVPQYWNPPSLFHLAQHTGFDIESLIFAFSIGGIGSVLYNITTKVTLQPVDKAEKHNVRHRFHYYILVSPVAVFLLLALFTHLNYIYCGIGAMLAGGIGVLWCRPDLKGKIWIGGLLFTILYFIYFSTLNLAFPAYVDHVWNFKELTGIRIWKMPIEEYAFAFTFGTFWSGIYEHIRWFKLRSKVKHEIAGI